MGEAFDDMGNADILTPCNERFISVLVQVVLDAR